MIAPARAFAWEIWRKNRVGNLVCLACLAVFVLQAMAWALWRLLTGNEPAVRGDAAAALVILPMFATFVWVLNIFAHTDRDARKGFSGVPLRLFTLPLPTTSLVGCLMAFGIVAIGGWYVAWAELVFRPFGLVLPLGWPVLVLAVAMSSFQTAVWALASFPWIRMGVIVIGAIGLIIVTAIGFGEPPPSPLDRHTVSALLFAWLPLTYASAVFGVNAERRGGWHAWARILPLLRSIADALPRWRGPFRSAEQAQFWFEWRRKGRFLTGALGCSIAGGVLLFPMAAFLDESAPLPVLSFLYMLFLPLVVTGSSGTELAKSDFWSSERAIQPFHAARPLSDAALVFAKLKVATLIILLGWLLAAALSVLLSSWTRWHEFWTFAHETARSAPLLALPSWQGVVGATTLLATMAITWHSMVAALAVGLSGRQRTVTIASLVGMVLFFTYLAGIGWFCFHPTQHPVLLGLFYLGLGAMTLWKLTDLLRAVLEVRRRELFDPRAIRFVLIHWLIVAICLVACTIALWQQTPTPRPLLLFLLVSFWPAGELPRCVLNLAANRHR